MEIYYVNGTGEIKKTDNLSKIHNNPLWIRLNDPDDNDIKKTADFTGININEFKDFLEDEERSRVEQGRILQIIYRTPAIDKGERTTTSFAIFFTKHCFVTIERKEIKSLANLSKLLQRGKLKFLFKKSAGYFVWHIFDKINDEFLSSIEKIGSSTRKIKANEQSEEQLLTIYNSNIALSHFSHALIANLEVLNVLKKSYLKIFTKTDLEHFEDLYFETLQIIDTEKIQRDVFSTMFNFQTVMASHKLNKNIKRLTVLAIIVSVPTLIASIYGMNIINLPLATHPQSFLLLVIIMLVVSVGLFFFMKVNDWL